MSGQDKPPLEQLSEEITAWYERETGLEAGTGSGGRGPGAGRFLDLLIWLEASGLLSISGIDHRITDCSIVLHSDEAWRTRAKRTPRERAALQLGASVVQVGGKRCRRWVYVLPPEDVEGDVGDGA